MKSWAPVEVIELSKPVGVIIDIRTGGSVSASQVSKRGEI
jgi:hypothetical protein